MRGLSLGLGIVAVAMGTCLLALAEDKPTKPTEKERFDLKVREDIFAGFAGDEEALARGLKACDEALKENPKHAEAMVWRGAGRVFQSGELFQNKKQAEGFKLYNAGLADLNEAVKLEPDNVGVRIPRAAVLTQASRGMPDFMAKDLLKTVKDDFESIYAKQKDNLKDLGTHPLGELRLGLADVYRRLKETEKSEEQLKAVVEELPKSKYAKRAEEWLAAKPDAKLYHNCIGCHTK